ncbi:MAG TPA: hypothetical protein VGR26_16495, partial [Acidimicrobiales bacterium]|nr:hypothetical protein [Acidimicrobiales bacterium]
PVRRLLEGLSVAAAASLITVWAYRIYDMTLRVPLVFGGDGATNQMHIKSIIENGWWLVNDDLGAPFAQLNHDFPAGGESLHFVLLKAMTLFSSDSALLFNLYYFATFPAVALVTFLVARHLRFSYALAALVSLLYAFLPYHFSHGPVHLLRSGYFAAPLALLLVLWALEGPDGFRTGIGASRRWRRGRLGASVLSVVAIATTDTMLAAFTMALLGAMALIVAIRHRSPTWLLPGVALTGGILAVFLLANMPTIVHAVQHGGNEVAGRRTVGEAELYGLKISDMVLPVPGHRIAALRELTAETEDSPVDSEGGQALGVIGALGFMAIVYRGLSRLVAPRPVPSKRSRLADHLSVVGLTAVLIGTISGFSLVLSVLGFAQIRAWNRIVVLIALACLLVVAAGLETAWPRLRRSRLVRPRPALAGGVLVAALLAVGLLDQVPRRAPDYRRLNAEFVSDKSFVDRIEEQLPDGAAVFQLPVVRYPEAERMEKMGGYDLLRGYLHSQTLRWSFGAVKGRDRADWQLKLLDEPPERLVRAVAAIGFDGLWIDRYGYDDRAANLEAELRHVVGTDPIVSDNGRLSFFDIRPYRRQLEQRRGEQRLGRIARSYLGEPSPLRG